MVQAAWHLSACKTLKPRHKAVSRSQCNCNNAASQALHMLHAMQVAWLLTLSGQPFQPPQQYDDPNLTCTNILSELRQAGFAPATYPPTKLRQGHGEAVCGVLNALCDLALEKTGFSFSAPTYLAETYVSPDCHNNAAKCQASYASIDDTSTCSLQHSCGCKSRASSCCWFKGANHGAHHLTMCMAVAWLLQQCSSTHQSGAIYMCVHIHIHEYCQL